MGIWNDTSQDPKVLIEGHRHHHQLCYPSMEEAKAAEYLPAKQLQTRLTSSHWRDIQGRDGKPCSFRVRLGRYLC